MPSEPSSKLAGLMSRWIAFAVKCELQKAASRLQDVVHRFPDRERTISFDHGRQVFACDVLHHQEVGAIGLVGVVSWGYDVRMV